MVTVTFTAHLQRHVDCPRHALQAATLAEALEQVFRTNPQARGYLLDDQGALRAHVAVFIDGLAKAVKAARTNQLWDP